MRNPIAAREGDLFCVASLVLDIEVGLVRLVISRTTGDLDRPEIVEEVRLNIQARARFHVDVLDPHAVGLGDEPVPNLSALRAADELLRKVGHGATSAQSTTSVAQSIGMEGLE